MKYYLPDLPKPASWERLAPHIISLPGINWTEWRDEGDKKNYPQIPVLCVQSSSLGKFPLDLKEFMKHLDACWICYPGTEVPNYKVKESCVMGEGQVIEIDNPLYHFMTVKFWLP